MKIEEAGKLLGFAALYDNRRVEVPDVMAWHRVIGDLPYIDAEQAIADHYRDSRERVMPSDIRERVKAIRSERLRLNPVPPPPAELLDDPPAYRKWLRETAQRFADGPAQHRAIGGTRP